MKKKINMSNKYKNLLIMVILFIVVFFTIGYSTFSTEIGIDNAVAILRVQKDIRISEIVPVNYTSNAESNFEKYNVKSIASEIKLPSSDSTVTYNVKVTNVGNMEAGILEIIGLPSNLEYTLNNYNLRDMLCDDVNNTKCKLGANTTLSITIGYKENGYDSSNTTYNIGMQFSFIYMVDSIAMIGDKFYDTLQDAIDDVPDDKTETTVILLNNTSETITIEKEKNVVLNLNDKVLRNAGNTNVIVNKGMLKLFGGSVTSNADSNGAINNDPGATISITGGHIIVTGGRQALYNKGNATITGGAYLSSSASSRAAVQNLKDSKMFVTGGSIISTGTYALNNAGELTIGEKDGIINTESPLIQGVGNGVYSSVNFKFYDGIVKSKIEPFNSVARITDKEDNYGILSSTEIIDGETYNTAYLGITKMIKFNAMGGTVSDTVRYVEENHVIGTLPTPTRSGYLFDGWYTLSDGGVKINANTVVVDDATYYAHWHTNTDVARIGTASYNTLQSAINAVPSNTQTTIVLMKDTNETLTIPAGKNIILDLNSNTVRNSGNNPIIENNGIISISNGNLLTSAEYAAVNNNAGRFTISSGQIISLGSKQAIYITGGSVEVTGTAYLSSQASGKPTDSAIERGTIQNLSGTLFITGGTIVGGKQQAVSNDADLTIGQKDGNINTSTPILIGEINGIKSLGTINFYDGIIKGKTNAIVGNVDVIEDNSQLISGTEIIDGVTYKTTYLGPIQ